MIKIKNTSNNEVFYATPYSSGFDISANEDVTIPCFEWRKVGTGLYLAKGQLEEFSSVGEANLAIGSETVVRPELQIRARSGLAYKHGVTLLNGVGTISNTSLWKRLFKEFRPIVNLRDKKTRNEVNQKYIGFIAKYFRKNLIKIWR